MGESLVLGGRAGSFYGILRDIRFWFDSCGSTNTLINYKSTARAQSNNRSPRGRLQASHGEAKGPLKPKN